MTFLRAICSDVWRWLLQPGNAVVTVVANVWIARAISHREHRKTSRDVKELKDRVLSNGNGRDEH